MTSVPQKPGVSLVSMSSERKVHDLDPSVEAELRLQLMQLRDHAIGATAQVGELRARLQQIESELEKKSIRIAQLRKDIDQREIMVRSSMTWRIGSFVMLPIRILRRLSRGS